MRATAILLPLLAVSLAGEVVVWFSQHRTETALRARSLELRQQINQAAPGRDGDAESAGAAVTNQAPASAANDQQAELERLRAETAARAAEITGLRARLASAEKSSEDLNLPASFRFENVRKEAWAFSGYATPEAALQSMLWAARDGNVSAIRDSLTPGELQRRQLKEWRGKTDAEIAELSSQGLAKATGFQILKVEQVFDNVHFTVYLDGLSDDDQPIWMDFKQIGDQWKADAYEHKR